MYVKNLNPVRGLDYEFVFKSYGVRVKVQACSSDLLAEAEKVVEKAFVGRIEILESLAAEHVFGIDVDGAGGLALYNNGERITGDASRPRFFKFFNSLVRITVAEHAKDVIFIHAGVVGRNGKAIVIPGNSFKGKTTLVTQLVRNGAEYYSDEYAVIDAEGLVHDFPRALSTRYLVSGEVREREVPLASIGGKMGSGPIPIGMVLLTEYVENAPWKPEMLTVGRGIMEMIPHTIPRQVNTEFALKVLNAAVTDAIIIRSPRGDAQAFALDLLSFFDDFDGSAKIN